MKLADYLDVDKLAEHCNSRVVNVQHHHYAPLTIYNYGQKAQFENIWDDVTVKTRGLIIDESTQEIVARPFQKFFNLGHAGRPETWAENLPAELPEITEKLDGSLGVLYRLNGFSGIATRGSFASDQATWASQWYTKNLSHAHWPDGWTPLFEIVYPDNRIVVRYGWEGLSLLSLVNNETGEELPYSSLFEIGSANGCRVVPLHRLTLDECRSDTQDNFEGYVATWHRAGQTPLKLKIKLIEYCRLHRLLTSISPKEIWRMLKDGESLEELFKDTPSHYQEWVSYWRNGLQAEYGRIEQKAQAIWASCRLPKNGADKDARKKLAEFFTLGDRKDVSGVLFKMLDEQPYAEVIWKMCRDKTRDQEPFRREVE
jgi:RNA ligase